jgi:glycosyltransferase involved in cell wall biosynthesis
MRVIHLSSVHHLSDPRFVQKMCPSLVNAGFETYIVIPGDEVPSHVLESGVKVHMVPLPSNRRERMLKTSAKVFQIGADLKGDIYHFHDPEGLPLALKWQKKLGRPFVYDIHENYPDDIENKTLLPFPINSFVSHGFRIYEEYAAKRIAGLVAATDYIAERFAWHPNIATVHNYPLLNEFQSPKDTKQGLFLFAGGLSPSRGMIEMVKAIEIANCPAELALAGNFFEPEMLEKCSRLAGWSRVSYKGYVSRKDLNKFMHMAIAGLVILQPKKAHIHSQPIKLFEYMAASLAVIASDFPLWRKIINSVGCGLLVDPTNTRSIAKAMNQLMDNPEETYQMGCRGRQMIEKQYHWEAIFPNLLSLYNRLEFWKPGIIND